MSTVVLATLAATVSFARPQSLPRKSPDFTIAEPSGKETLLSSFKGKVVVMEFFFLQSNHCTRVAKMLNDLSKEMGPRGFQAIGVVFDPPNAPESHGHLVAPAVSYFKLTYPVGYSSKIDVDTYLSRQPREVLNIPQLVVIDRAGMIRAMSGPAGGDPWLEDEGSLRTMIDALLKENRIATNKH
jgi:hypothetical protein